MNDFNEPPAQRHSPTSIAAAAAIKTSAGTMRWEVLDCIKRSGERGATDEEIQRALRMNPSTERPRRIELYKAGLIIDSGTTRLTHSRRSAVVWKAKSDA